MSLCANIHTTQIDFALTKHLSRGYVEMLYLHRGDQVHLNINSGRVLVMIDTVKLGSKFETTYSFKHVTSGQVVKIVVKWDRGGKSLVVSIDQQVDINWNVLLMYVMMMIVDVEKHLNIQGSPHMTDSFGCSGIAGEGIEAQINRARNNTGGRRGASS